MASSTNFHHYPKVELTSTSPTTTPSTHGPWPQPSAPPLPEDTDTNHVELPATGYPPVMGYPPNHDHPHILPPPPPSLILPPHPLPPRRIFVSLYWAMAALIGVVMVVSLVSAIVCSLYQPRTPSVTVVGMSVLNFTISGGAALTADWEVNVTVKNPSARLTATFVRTMTSIYYRNMLLTWSKTEPFELGKKGQGSLSVSLTAEGKEQQLDEFVISEMQMDRKNGEMSFDIVMGMSVAFRNRPWWTSNRGFRVSCSIIRVGFESGSGGSMLGGVRGCEVS